MNERKFLSIIVWMTLVIVVMTLVAKTNESASFYDKSACATPPLRDAAKREQALVDGYTINPTYDCIDKASYDAVQRQMAEAEMVRSQPKSKPGTVDTLQSAAKQSLTEARHNFTTAITIPSHDKRALPRPPSNLFVRSDYQSGGLPLAAFVTPDPRDARKHPAIIWLTGGDSNSLDDFWTPGAESNDQSASAYREAGVVMMFPTLRGGNNNPGKNEFMFGEVADVLAAADHLAKLPYVDPKQIYLGGHSTGGTLALLTSESGGIFRAVFAFGAVSSPDGYPRSIFPLDFDAYPSEELKLRSPLHWLDGIVSPTYLLEGTDAPSNVDSLNQLCKASRNPLMHCLPVEQADHFSVLSRANRLIAARIVMNELGMGFALSLKDIQAPKK